MVIVFKTSRVEELCNDDRLAIRKLGAVCAAKLRTRLDDLKHAPSLDAVPIHARCHPLKGNQAGLLAITVHAGYRLVFQPHHDPIPMKSDGGLDLRNVTCVCVVSVEDYHHG